ncbi:hypothetical protein [Telluribacter sp. SYSU D00476]|uniref:hypothetical protein n=1 Tax=Telluribacter sp. SYSU D00476 TaxID=2811430 RepID=UPI001FF15C06|nr:hypothetical protein [Telluribacter sp. SYSU D00476]
MNLIIYNSFNRIFHFLSLATSYKRWKTTTAIICTFTSILLNNPDYLSFYSTSSYHWEFSDYRANWKTIYDQSLHPLTPQHHTESTHRSKRAFRLAPALVGKLLPHTSLDTFIRSLFFLQHALGFAFFYLFLTLVHQLSGMKAYAMILTLGLPFIYLGNAFFWDTYGWFDGFALFSLLAATYSLIMKRLWLVPLFLSLAFWTDERSIIVSPVILFWIPLIEDKQGQTETYPLWKKVALLYLLTIGLYISIRLSLGWLFHLSIPVGFSSLVGIKMVLVNMQSMPHSLLNTFDGYWIFPILSLIWLWNNSSKTYAVCSVVLFTLCWGISYSVLDVTRSLTYAYLWILLAIILVGKNTEYRVATAIALLATTISFISPTLFFLGKSSFSLFNFHQLKVLASQFTAF